MIDPMLFVEKKELFLSARLSTRFGEIRVAWLFD
jgi:hypothetical protein